MKPLPATIMYKAKQQDYFWMKEESKASWTTFLRENKDLMPDRTVLCQAAQLATVKQEVNTIEIKAQH